MISKSEIPVLYFGTAVHYVTSYCGRDGLTIQETFGLLALYQFAAHIACTFFLFLRRFLLYIRIYICGGIGIRLSMYMLAT